MASINKVILIGGLGKDSEIKHTSGGQKIAHLSVATSETWKDKSGQKQERTEWHKVVVFSPALADIAEKYLRKGSKVYIEGSLQTRKYTDNSGQDKYTTEVVLSPYKGTIVLLDATKVSSETTADGKYQQAKQGNDTGWNNEPSGGLDDEIPF